MMTNEPAISMPVEVAAGDIAFQQECLELLTPYYSDPDIPLRYAFDHETTHVYLVRGDRGTLTSVFFARAPERVLEDLPPVGYMGLTATAAEHKGQHQARLLWRAYLIHSRQAAGEAELLAWYRTATPFGLYPCHHLLADGEPRSDGGFSHEGVSTVRKLRRQYGLPAGPSDDHPFVVRRYAAARYSNSEQERIPQCRNHESIGLLDRLEVSEQRGDRLLMLGRIP